MIDTAEKDAPACYDHETRTWRDLVTGATVQTEIAGDLYAPEGDSSGPRV